MIPLEFVERERNYINNDRGDDDDAIHDIGPLSEKPPWSISDEEHYEL